MATEKEQAKPLAPSLFQSRSSDEEEANPSKYLINFHQRKYIKCCGCFTAFFLILAVTILVLSFTVFHAKDPIIHLNNITLIRLDLVNSSTLRIDANITLVADVSVKNPNIASFKFNNGTTTVLYGGTDTVVGDAITPSGKAKARRTTHMNVTVDLIPEKIMGVPSFIGDVSSGELSFNSRTVIGGKVKILKIIKKYVVVEVNCTVTHSFFRKEIQQHCRPHFT